MSGPKLNESTVLLGLLEDGDLSRDLSAQIIVAIQKTREAVGAKQTGACSVTLKLAFKVDGDSVEIATEISASIPKAPRGKTMFFLTREGDISTQHPKQYGMPFDDDDDKIERLRR
jgi:hypothetical protein